MAADPQKSLYMVKFLFADASFIEESFAADITVNDAKQKLISNWPAGKKQDHPSGGGLSQQEAHQEEQG